LLIFASTSSMSAGLHHASPPDWGPPPPPLMYQALSAALRVRLHRHLDEY